jgi:hypothetical protein
MLKNPVPIVTFFKTSLRRPEKSPLHYAETQPLNFLTDGNNNTFMHRG